MAFTFLVEDGTIVPGANSYVTVEEADSFLEVDFRQWPIWEPLEVEDKQKMLALATRYLDQNYQWFGKKVEQDQPLEWPRRGALYCDRTCVAQTVIPTEVKNATMLLAVWLRTNDGEEQLNSPGVRRFRSEEIEIEWQDSFEGRAGPEFLSKLLICFGYGPNDRGFKPIIRK